jgi:hypothetical protein
LLCDYQNNLYIFIDYAVNWTQMMVFFLVSSPFDGKCSEILEECTASIFRMASLVQADAAVT